MRVATAVECHNRPPRQSHATDISQAAYGEWCKKSQLDTPVGKEGGTCFLRNFFMISKTHIYVQGLRKFFIICKTHNF